MTWNLQKRYKWLTNFGVFHEFFVICKELSIRLAQIKNEIIKVLYFYFSSRVIIIERPASCEFINVEILNGNFILLFPDDVSVYNDSNEQVQENLNDY